MLKRLFLDNTPNHFLDPDDFHITYAFGSHRFPKDQKDMPDFLPVPMKEIDGDPDPDDDPNYCHHSRTYYSAGSRVSEKPLVTHVVKSGSCRSLIY